jgi:hypothetical protein
MFLSSVSPLFAFYIKSSTDVIDTPFASSFWLILRELNPTPPPDVRSSRCDLHVSVFMGCIHERVHRDDDLRTILRPKTIGTYSDTYLYGRAIRQRPLLPRQFVNVSFTNKIFCSLVHCRRVVSSIIRNSVFDQTVVHGRFSTPWLRVPPGVSTVAYQTNSDHSVYDCVSGERIVAQRCGTLDSIFDCLYSTCACIKMSGETLLNTKLY